MALYFTFWFLLWTATIYANFVYSTSIKGKGFPVCDKKSQGQSIFYKTISGEQKVLICTKSGSNDIYQWMHTDGSPAIGERFSPAKDCADVADNLENAINGFYWIKLPDGKAKQAWCDVNTDGGGFILVGKEDSPVTWTVPSNPTPVDPKGLPHWSSEFGDLEVLDFAVQISVNGDVEGAQAHWMYRLNPKRKLGEIFSSGQGGCTDSHSGIGNILFVKDLLTETIVTTKFNCSKFGHHTHPTIGWGRMNHCLKNECPKGYAFVPGLPGVKLDSFGSFSYSAISPISGVSHDATAFVGCDNNKCCACFGPKGGTKNYCSRQCKATNGGTVITGNVHTWFWIRTRLPTRVWKRCMEFKTRTVAGKEQTYFIDRRTGTTYKGSCSTQFHVLLNEGTLSVSDEKSLQEIPPVKGLISYREDNKRLYVNEGSRWNALSTVTEVQKLNAKLNETMKVVNILKNRINDIFPDGSKSNPGKSCKDIRSNFPFGVSGVYSIRPLGKKSNKVFQVYCDMETQGGGWTLVYSYTFTNYNNMVSSRNAVTPVPNWPASTATVPVSNLPPLTESTRGAVDYNLWKDIGREILIKSNINHWLICQENGGSLVMKKNGPMKCHNIKNVAPKCHGYAPYKITWYPAGPSFDHSSHYYYFEGDTRGSWPTHDPCGNNQRYEKQGVANPGGAVFLR